MDSLAKILLAIPLIFVLLSSYALWGVLNDRFPRMPPKPKAQIAYFGEGRRAMKADVSLRPFIIDVDNQVKRYMMPRII